MDHLKLTTDLLSVDTISDLVCDDSCGAVSIFVGTTRDNFEGKKVLRLEYEAYEPMAIKAMKNICDEVRNKWSSVHSIAMYHRLGQVPIREASVVIAVSSPHRQHSLSAVAHCIERLKSSVPIWKKEVYDAHAPVWKENVESQAKEPSPPPQETQREEIVIDPSMVQINVSNEELQKRIQNFIERKREQVNMSNIQDFIPSKSDKEEEEMETCARVRTQFVRRNDSKGHLKIRKVHNEWGPLCASARPLSDAHSPTSGLPPAIAERVLSMERFLHAGPVPRDIYRRLKGMEDRLKELEALSPEYAHFWKSNKDTPGSTVKQEQMDYTFSADDIAKKIEQFERQGEL